MAILYVPEIAASIRMLEDVSNARRVWFFLEAQQQGLKYLVCGVYGPPGGDYGFWLDLCHERAWILASDSESRTVLVGDFNVHFPGLLTHDEFCFCCQCKPSAVDRSIVSLLSSVGLECKSPAGFPTHVSGTAIDGFVFDIGYTFPLVQVSAPGAYASSDHSLVRTQLPCGIVFDISGGFGRVAWSDDETWDSVLLCLDNALYSFSLVINSLAARFTHLTSTSALPAAQTSQTYLGLHCMAARWLVHCRWSFRYNYACLLTKKLETCPGHVAT